MYLQMIKVPIIDTHSTPEKSCHLWAPSTPGVGGGNLPCLILFLDGNRINIVEFLF